MPLKTRKFLLFLALTLFCTGIFSSEIEATTLAKYRENVGAAYDTLDFLSYPEENLSDAENLKLEREKIKQIRTLLPKTDKIELQNGSFEVNNLWLHEKLSQYEGEAFGSPNRGKIIGELSDRLAALEEKLTELENQAAGERSKDEDKRKLGEILKRAEFQKQEEKQESAIQKAIREFLEWLRKETPRPNYGKAPEEDNRYYRPLKPFLQFVVFLAAFGLIGFLLYRFAPVLLKNFREREKRDKETRVILGETLAADETSQNLFSEAENLARNGELRAAIRKGYIAFLCELSDRKVIGLARHKTNRDYLRDVRKRENLHRNLGVLTQDFERHWYGFEAVRAEDWETFKKQYKEAVNKGF